MFSTKSLVIIHSSRVFSFGHSAATALQNICVGMNALTSDNEVVGITAIKETRSFSSRGITVVKFSPENLSPEVEQTGAFSAGTVVINPSNEMGKVLKVSRTIRCNITLVITIMSAGSILSEEASQFGDFKRMSLLSLPVKLSVQFKIHLLMAEFVMLQDTTPYQQGR